MPQPNTGYLTGHVILTALAAEKKALCGGSRRRPGRPADTATQIIQCGLGCRAMLRAAVPLPAGSSLVGNIGVSGGLAPQQPTGTMVLAEQILNQDALPDLRDTYTCRPELVDLLQSVLEDNKIPCLRGSLLCVGSPLATVAEKKIAYQATGALAVDMESAGAAEAAVRAGLPFFCMRVISDPAERKLAPELFAGVDEQGNSRPGRLLAVLLQRPWLLAQLFVMGRDFSRACNSMARAWKVVRPLLAAYGAGAP